MSMPDDYELLFDDEEEDRKRKAEIEDMMRWQRENYFRNEPVQQEYRDLVTRLSDNEEARANGTGAAFRGPGPFDLALQRFQERKPANAEESASEGQNNEPDASISEPSQIDTPELVRVAQNDVSQGQPATATNKSSLPTAPMLGGFAIPLRWDGNNRVEELQLNNPDRPLRIQPILSFQLNYAAQKNGVGIEVHSGGQVAEGEIGPRLKDSGPRHNHGSAADVDLYVTENGKRRYLDSQNPDDRKIMQNFIRDAVIAGATGIGHGYMNTGVSKTRRIHVGGGDPSIAWRDQIKGRPDLNSPFPWVEAARAQGVAARQKLVPHAAWPYPVAQKPAGAAYDGTLWNRFGGPKSPEDDIFSRTAQYAAPRFFTEDERLSMIRRMLDNYRQWTKATK